MAIVIRGIDAFRIFELPLVLVGRTEPVISTYAYFEYVEAINPNTSAAAGTILLIMILVTLVGYIRIMGREEAIR
jgi:trehalose transport system permease protein